MRRPLLLAALFAGLFFGLMAGNGLADARLLLGSGAVASFQDNDAAGLPYAFSFSAEASGSAQSISVYVDSGSSASGLVAGVYADNGGHPGGLLASGSSSAPVTGQWNQITLDSTPSLSSGTTYWLAVLPTGGQLNLRDVVPATGGCSETPSQTNVTTLPSNWNSGASWASCSLSAYVSGPNVSSTTPAPVVSALPVVGGQAVVGQTLVASDGSWSGSPTAFAFQWQACDSSGGGCTNIAGATSGSYTLTSGEVGQTVDVVVTASNAGGSASATSAASAVVSSSAAPGASFTFSPAAPVTGSGVQFDGRASTCAAGPCTYTWADDPPTGGSWPLGTGQTIGFTFTGVGTKYVTLTVTDALGHSASVEHNVVVTAASTNAPPANTAVPTVSGVAQQGQTLTASNGSWTGSPTSYAYQWQDCDSAGSNCAAIAGATSGSYALGSSDIGHTIRVAETATNAAGSATAASAQTVVVAAQSGPSAPSNTSAPVITGAAQSGQTLAVSNGSWSNGPTGYAYAWRDCDSSGNSCTTISAATSSSYLLASSDVGHTVRAIVTATNAGGSTPATSAQTSVVSGSGRGCSGAANTPGGPDPWGGCFPGPTNTGVPAGTSLVAVNSSAQDPPNAALASDNHGWVYSSSDHAIDITQGGAVIDGVSSSGINDNVTGGGYTLKDSQIDGTINSAGTSNGNVLIENSTLNGGQQARYPTVGIPNVDIESSNVSGGEHEVNCEGTNCTVRNSWLHDNFDGLAQGAHQNGFFSNGTSNDTLTHNSIYCFGGCTADISVLNGGAVNGFSASNNLLVASPRSDYCVYPGPNSATYYAPISAISWTDNVFQKGSNGKCGWYGPVYGWYPSMCAPPSSCTWTGNMWDDGTALDEPYH